jgi:tetratricopeptide (TPR) repeat protein
VTDALSRLLTEGERAAFHGSPQAALVPLRQAMALAEETGRSAEAAAATWLLGVAYGAAGDYGQAAVALRPLLEAAVGSEPSDRLIPGLALATRADHLRQLGRIAEAAARDNQALDLAGDDLDPVAFEALLGLAADAVAAADLDTARERVGAADKVLARNSGWWRQRVELEWVKSDLARSTDDIKAAAAAATAALTAAEEAGAPRHVARSLMLLAVAQLQEASRGASASQSDTGATPALATLRRAGTLAETLGALPLVWPVRALQAALTGDEQESARAIAAARAAVKHIADSLATDPEDTDGASAWLARPEVAALRG